MPVAHNVAHASLAPSEPAKRNLEAGRLDTFHNWPHPADGACSRQNMARAGFFYTGPGDRVKCFVCGLQLQGWEPAHDEPWQRHLEAAPMCLFAKLAKEEGALTVEQWLDVFCNQALNTLDSKLNKLR